MKTKANKWAICFVLGDEVKIKGGSSSISEFKGKTSCFQCNNPQPAPGASMVD